MTNNPANLLYGALGKALTQWSIVDRQLTDAYAICVNPEFPAPAAASIWQVVSHQTKVKMIESAYEVRRPSFSENERTQIDSLWKLAKSKIKVANESRNQLGHASIRLVQDSEGLAPYLSKDKDIFKTWYVDGTPPKFYSVSDIEKIEIRCVEAMDAIGKFLGKLNDSYEKQEIKVSGYPSLPKKNLPPFVRK